MQKTITEQVSIDKLDYRLNATDAKSAPYQLEIYHTKEEPQTNIGVLNKNTKKFSYQIGDTVDVTQKVNVSTRLFLTNIVANSFLQNYLSRTK